MKIWLRVGISAGLLVLLAVLLPWSELRGAFARISLGIWVVVLAGFLFGHTLGAVKWRLMVAAGRTMLTPRDTVRCYSAGLFANLCLPTIVGGDVLRAVLAGKATGRPEGAVLGGIADRIVDMATVALLVAVGGFLSRDALPGWGLQLLSTALIIGIAVAVIFLPLLLRRPLTRWPRKIRRPAGRALVALRGLARNPRTAVIAVLISIAVQGGFVLLNAWMGIAIGVTAPLTAWFIAWPMAKLAGMLPVSLGGLGVRDATLAALLVPFGVPLTIGFVASLLWQTVLIAGGLAAGAIWWILSARTAGSGEISRNLTLRTSSVS
ncbi:MAG TPA: lysylphosphatidylglycerol synthase transmembrane domain-containing protein [Longimicrobiales bacterium]